MAIQFIMLIVVVCILVLWLVLEFTGYREWRILIGIIAIGMVGYACAAGQAVEREDSEIERAVVMDAWLISLRQCVHSVAREDIERELVQLHGELGLKPEDRRVAVEQFAASTVRISRLVERHRAPKLAPGPETGTRTDWTESGDDPGPVNPNK